MSEVTVMPLELRRSTGDGHVLEGLCVPYNRVTLKAGYPRGERFMPGAFQSLPRAGANVRLIDNGHNGGDRRPVGVSTGFEETADGLMGRFRFYNTPEGRGAWENVTEETYGGLSVGFYAKGQRTAPDGVREVFAAQLHHVALVDEPAYAEAKVLAVRAARPPLPDVSDLLARTYDLGLLPDRPDVSGVPL